MTAPPHTPPAAKASGAVPRPLRVMMLGLRGFPDVQGGIEAHAENLSRRLVEMGCDVEVVMRAPYVPARTGSAWRGVRVRRIWAPRRRGLEAVLHTLFGVLYAAVSRPDVLHIHAIGPAIWTPLARLLRLRVVVTHHGADYERQQWGAIARQVLRLGERVGMRMACGRIAVSATAARAVQRHHGVAPEVIPNGVVLPEIADTTAALQRFDLQPGRFVLMVSRLVAEKRHLDLIDAFRRAQPSGWKLVLVGASDHPDRYSASIVAAARSAPAVVMTGFQSGRALRELYSHAGLFVLPSSHEGLPIALLEALSYGLPVLASDISAHLELNLQPHDYFRLGDVSMLASRLRALCLEEPAPGERRVAGARVARQYDWSRVAAQTLAIYHAAAGPLRAH